MYDIIANLAIHFFSNYLSIDTTVVRLKMPNLMNTYRCSKNWKASISMGQSPLCRTVILNKIYFLPLIHIWDNTISNWLVYQWCDHGALHHTDCQLCKAIGSWSRGGHGCLALVSHSRSHVVCSLQGDLLIFCFAQHLILVWFLFVWVPAMLF